MTILSEEILSGFVQQARAYLQEIKAIVADDDLMLDTSQMQAVQEKPSDPRWKCSGP